ncbi:MAG: sensor histidine kinase [Chitinophagales bacterium]
MTNNHHFLDNLIDTVPLGIIVLSETGEVLKTNQQAIEIIGISIEEKEPKEKRLSDLMDSMPEWSEYLQMVIKKRLQPFNFVTSSFENKTLKLQSQWISDTFIIFVEDITKINSIEKQALHATLEGQEQERRRIAQEIHDGLGPLFSSLTMHIESLEAIIEEKTPEFIFECSILRELSKTIAQDIRAISHDLMPSAVEDFGVATALENLCDSTNEVAKAEISFYGTNVEQRLDKNIELGLYRIGQELLNNALKYSKAENIVIQLIRHPNSIVLMVEDDGIGFDNQLMKDKKKGIGWRNINTRTKSLGGLFTIDSRVGEGVLGTVEIPLKN